VADSLKQARNVEMISHTLTLILLQILFILHIAFWSMVKRPKISFWTLGLQVAAVLAGLICGGKNITNLELTQL